MDMVETTKQLPPPVNILNNSERKLRLTFHPSISLLKCVCVCIISPLSNPYSSFLKLSTYFPKSLDENYIMI